MEYALIILAIILLDQLSKKKALKTLKEKSFHPLNKRFQLRLAKNRGAFYGLLQNKKVLLKGITILTIIACMILLYAGIKNNASPLYNTSFSFLIGGALGNLWDRIKRGYVVDFIYFKVKNGPIFNIADIFIFLGALFLCYLEIIYGIW